MSAEPSKSALDALHKAEEAAKAPEAKTAPAEKPAEGKKHGVDGSIGDLLSSIGEAAVRVAQVPGKVHHERASAAHAAEAHAKEHEKDHKTDEKAPEGGDHPKGGHGHDSAEKHGDFGHLVDETVELYKAWDKGEVEEGHVKDVADAALDLFGFDRTRGLVPLLGRPLLWAFNKVLGAHKKVHEIKPEYSNLGTQILAWEPDKDGSFHHSYEGLVKGIKDVNALNRAFRHFHDKTIFEAAVKGDRPNLQKRIMALLGEEGDMSETEVRSFITTIMHRLGGHGHGVPPHAHIAPHHPLRASLDPNHKALLKLYENAFNWLDKDTLDKIFSDKEPEKNFKIDFEHFGDLLLEEVNPANRDRYLKSVNAKTFEGTFKAKFPYLTNEGALRTALKKDTEREKVLTQLRQFTGVDYAMDLDALKGHIQVLKERVGDEPMDVDGPIVPPSTTPSRVKGPLYHEYKAFEAALTLVQTTMTNTGALTDLFEGKVEEKAMNYEEIGAEVLRRVKTPTDAQALDAIIKPVEIELAIGSLLNAETIEDEIEADLPGIRVKIANLFGIKGAVTKAQIIKQGDVLETALMLAPVGSAKLAKLLLQIQNAKALLTGGGVPRAVEVKFLDKLYGKESGPKKIAVDADRLGETIFSLDTDEERESFEVSVKANTIVARFHALSEKDSLVGEFNRNAQETVAELRALFGLEKGTLTTDRVNTRKGQLLTRLGVTSPDKTSTNSLHKIGVLLENVAAAFVAADGQTLVERLGDKAWSITYDQIANHIFTEVTTEDDQALFLRNYKDGLLRSEFPALFPTTSIAGLMGERGSRAEVKSELSDLFGLRGVVNERVLEGRKTALLARLSEGAKAEPDAYGKLEKSLTEVVKAVKPHLKQLFAPEALAFETGNFGRTLETVEEPGDIARFLTAYRKNARQFNAFYHELFNKDALEAALLDESQRKVLVAKLKAFLGLDSGVANISKNDITTTLTEFRTRLGKEEDLPDANTKTAHSSLIGSFGEVEALLVNDSEEYLKRILKGNEIEPDYNALGAQIRKLDANTAKLVELLSSLDVARMVPLLTLRELPMTAASLKPKQVKQVATALRNLIGLPDDQALTPTSFQYLGRDLFERLTPLTNLRNFPQAVASSATSLAQTLRFLLEGDLSDFFAKLPKAA